MVGDALRRAAVIRNDLLPFLEIKTGSHGAFSVRKHSHEEVSIGIVEKGANRISVLSRHFHMQEKEAVLFPPDTAHLCEPDDRRNFSFAMIYIDKEWCGKVFNLSMHALKTKTVLLSENDIQIKQRFFKAVPSFEDALTAESEAVLYIGGLLFDVFTIEQIPSTYPPAAVKEKNKADEAFANVKRHMDKYFTEPVSLSDLCDVSGLGKFPFLRKFKALYKLTPHAYLLNKRINYAKQLLQSGESVAMTAQMCGFFDQSHFIKTFRRFVGMNPAEYK